MDNFANWVDAPTEALIPTPEEDESNCHLRDEILQTQQYVIDKLDEQRNNEKDNEDSTTETQEQAMKLKSELKAEAQRAETIRLEYVELQKACRFHDMKLISMRQNFPSSDLSAVNHTKTVDEMDRQISKFKDQLANREKELEKLLKRNEKGFKSRVKDTRTLLKKLKTSILEEKGKQQKFKQLRVETIKLKAAFNEVSGRQAKEKDEIASRNASLDVQRTKLETLNEESVDLRAQLVQIESNRARSHGDFSQKEIDRLLANADKNREKTAALLQTVDAMKEETAFEQKKLDSLREKKTESSKKYDDRMSTVMALLRKKFEEAKEKARKEDVMREVVELKKSIEKENDELEEAQKELGKLKPENIENLSALKKEVATMETGIRTNEKKTKEAVKENEKLMQEIASMNVVSSITPRTRRNGDSDATEYMESYSSETIETEALRPPVVTPIQHRQVSVDVFGPLATSTPRQPILHRPESGTPALPQRAMQTRGAARRLADTTPAPKTTNPRKKRGGKN